MATNPPDDESWTWDVLESVQVSMGGEVWTVLLAVAAQPDGWYVRLSRVMEAEGLVRDLILDGPYPDRTSAVVSAHSLILGAGATLGGAITAEHRNGAGPPG